MLVGSIQSGLCSFVLAFDKDIPDYKIDEGKNDMLGRVNF